MREALKTLPEIIVTNILYGFLSNNILDLLMNKEIDIFISDKNIGFEINGGYFHSNNFNKDN